MDFGITIEKSKVVWRQVADQVRKKILSGELTPGTKLPSTAAMAAQVGTDVPTLHRALTELVAQGLITRTPRIGTHVAQWEKGLLRLGVYHSCNIMANPGAASHRVMEAEVQKAATALKISVQVWTDPRPSAKQGTALPVVEYAARERIIQGLISTDGDATHRGWFQKLPVPVAHICNLPDALIDFDHENFIELSVDALRRQGCRSAALLSPLEPESNFLRHFFSACQRAGLATRPEWQQGDAGFHTHKSGANDAAAYHSFKRMWHQSERPEGLIVYPDIFSPGVAMAILHEKVRVPQDLKVVFHRNEEVELFVPFEATFVTSAVADAARAMLDHLDMLLKGREPKRVLIQHAVMYHSAA